MHAQENALRRQKDALRRHVFAKRDLVSSVDARVAAEAVAKSGLIFAREQAKPGSPIAAYWPMRSELHTRPLMEALSTAGFLTALPVARGAAPLEFHLWSVGDDLVRGALGNPEPVAGETVTPALIFAPLAAFDSNGGRIGYGAGHYDRTIASLRAAGTLVAAGLAYDLQEVDAVPREPHDERLDFILTETRLLATGAR